MAGVGLARLGKEIKMLADEPPPGVCAWPVDDCITHLQAQIQGPEDTPYERGTFLLDLQIPERYPFEPPKVRFVTPIYHPNIDSGGRICLDTLKMRPAGSWAPSMNVPTLLTTIRLLMAHPNGDDGLMPDITELFLKNPSRFADVARAHVEEHARGDTSASSKSLKDEATASEGPPAGVAAAAAGREATAGASSSSTELKPAASAPAALADDGDGPERGGEKQGSAAARATTGPVVDGSVGDARRRGASPAPPENGEEVPAGGSGTAVGAGEGHSAAAAAAAAEAAGEAGTDARGDMAQGRPGGNSSKGGRNRDGGDGEGRSSGEDGEAESDSGGASSDDGAWSDSDEDNDDDGEEEEEDVEEEGAPNAKRARNAP